MSRENHKQSLNRTKKTKSTMTFFYQSTNFLSSTVIMSTTNTASAIQLGRLLLHKIVFHEIFVMGCMKVSRKQNPPPLLNWVKLSVSTLKQQI